MGILSNIADKFGPQLPAEDLANSEQERGENLDDQIAAIEKSPNSPLHEVLPHYRAARDDAYLNARRYGQRKG